MPITYTTIPPDAQIKEFEKVTKGFFPGGIGTAVSGTLTTASLASTQKKYYLNLQYSSKDCLSVGYGHWAGSGSDTAGDAHPGSTEAQYKQLANMVLFDSQMETGFTFTGSSTNWKNRQDDIYFIIAERAQMLDRINKRNWTIKLSGSFATNVNGADIYGSSSKIWLTDDSRDVAVTNTPGGPRYNIVSGTLGNVAKAATERKYGYFYPDLGLFVLNVTALTSSAGHKDGLTYVAGQNVCITGAVPWRATGSNTKPGTDFRGNGLNPATGSTSDVDGDNAFKLAVALEKGAVTLRSEEDQTTKSYFCRAKAGDFNFTNNPTFVTGSNNEMYQASYEGNPQTFITTIGLYNTSQELVAVGRLSKPVKKNYGTERSFKVNITY